MSLVQVRWRTGIFIDDGNPCKIVICRVPMIFDFDDPLSPLPVRSDVCILGAGAAGILLATQMAAAGLRIALFEGGGHTLEPRSQELYDGEIVGLPYSGLTQGRFRLIGGTTTEWGGQIMELDEADFQSREWIAGSGWPFEKTELTNYYRRALQFEGLYRADRSAEDIWRRLGIEPPDLTPEFTLGFSYWCPERNFARLHLRSLSECRNIALYKHANAVGFDLNAARNAIDGVRLQGFSGRKATACADVFVISLGGIESTRFLLQPDERALPWQVNGHLGRHYQDHIGCNGIAVDRLLTQPAHRYFGYVSAGSFTYHAKLRLHHDQQRMHRTMNVAGTIGPMQSHSDNSRSEAERLLRKVRDGQRNIAPMKVLWLSRHLPAIARDIIRRRTHAEPPPWKNTTLSVHCEQSPLSASAISLSEERDALGLRRARLHWKISADEIRSIRTYVRIAEGVFRRTGFGRIRVPRGFYEDDSVVIAMCGDSFHHMGSTRMSASATDGVVDQNLGLHGVANGFVCSSSVFPSSGFSNPTHTVLALAMRLCDHIVQRLQRPRPPIAAIYPCEGAASPDFPALRRVKLPGHSGRSTTQLGFGCAYLFSSGLDAVASRRLLDAAWDAGIRHFDVAPVYGHGRSEALLGSFLREHPEATVTTKYGLFPSGTVARALSFAQRQIPGLNGREVRLNRRSARFTANEARASLECSLRLLQRDYIDIFLLHEPEPNDLVHQDLLQFLELARCEGKIGDYGIGGEYSRIPALAAERKPYCRVMQFEWSLLGPDVDLPGSFRIHYRLFAKATPKIISSLQENPAMAKRWSQFVGADVTEPMILSRLMLRGGLDSAPESPALFSTVTEAHIVDCTRTSIDEKLRGPASRLSQLISEEMRDRVPFSKR